jgi:hypothetical protein
VVIEVISGVAAVVVFERICVTVYNVVITNVVIVQDIAVIVWSIVWSIVVDTIVVHNIVVVNGTRTVVKVTIVVHIVVHGVTIVVNSLIRNCRRDVTSWSRRVIHTMWWRIKIIL